jgi:hypothetical protein
VGFKITQGYIEKLNHQMKNIIDYTNFLNEAHSNPKVAQLLDQEKERLDSFGEILKSNPEYASQELQLTAYLIEGIGSFYGNLVSSGASIDPKVLADLKSMASMDWDQNTLGWFFNSYRELLNEIDPDKSM